MEEVGPQEVSVDSRIHYLPHHAVVRTVCVVCDASARSTGCSLNECLHKGPKFDQKILDILVRFPTYKIAPTADIQKAFLMVSVQESDLDVLRFLWFNDIQNEECEKMRNRNKCEKCELLHDRVVIYCINFRVALI